MAFIPEQTSIQGESHGSNAKPLQKNLLYAIGGVLAVAAVIIGLSVGLTANQRKSKSTANSNPAETIHTTSLDEEGTLFETVSFEVPLTAGIHGAASPYESSSSSDSLSFLGDAEKYSGNSINGIADLGDDDGSNVILKGEPSPFGIIPGSISMQGPLDAPFDYLQTIENALYSGTGLANSTFFCFPRNSSEVIQAVASVTCRVVFLSRDFDNPYNVRREMRVYGYKIIIGHPVRRPLITPAKGVVRPFRVMPGGHLDARFISLGRRSTTINTTNPETRLTVGGSVLVDANARFTGSGVLFYETPQTWESYIERLEDPGRARTWGGFIINLGGDVTLLGCQFWTLRQFGNPTTDNAGSGGDSLTIQGNYVEIGTFHVGTNMYQNSANMGSTVANWGGAVVLIGSGSVSTTAALGTWTIGSNIFIGGGVMIMSAYEVVTTSLVMARAGGASETVCGGAYVHVGYVQVRQWGWASSYRVGQTNFVGGGILIAISYEQASSANCLLYVGIGLTFYVGAGQMDYDFGATVRDTLCYCIIGAGGSWAVGAGLLNYLYSYAVSFTGWQASMIAGSAVFVGAGWLNMINITSQSWVVDQYFTGEGSNVFVGAGGALLIGNKFESTRRYSYSTTPWTFYIANQGISRAQSTKNMVVTHTGIYPFRGRRELAAPDQAPLASSGSSSNDQPRAGVYIIDDKTVECTGTFKSISDLKNATMFKRPLVPLTYAEQLAHSSEQECEDLSYGHMHVPNSTDCFTCSTEIAVSGNCSQHADCKGNSTKEILTNMMFPSYAGVSNTDSAVDISVPGIGPLDASNDLSSIMDSVFLIRAEVTIHCQRQFDNETDMVGDISHYNHGCIRANVVKDAIRALIPHEGYRLAVASAGVIDEFRPLLRPELFQRRLHQMPSSREVLESCLAWSKYHVYFASRRKQAAEVSDRGWKEILKNVTVLYDEVLRQKDMPLAEGVLPSSPAKLCDLVASTKDSLSIPTKTVTPVDPFGISGAPAITILGEDNDFDPDTVNLGETYEIAVTNFPNISAVSVMLVPVNSSIASGLETGPILATLEPSDFKPKNNVYRLASFPWKPRTKAGKYYIKAYMKLAPLFSSYSDIFTVEA